MKTERSAGGIIVRDKLGTWEVLVMQDKRNAWTFPKGKIDSGETSEQAARREIHEEVGLTQLSVLSKLPAIHYIYKRGTLIAKTVNYFIFEYGGTEEPVSQASEGIHDAQWMSIPNALDIIDYPKTNKPLLLWTLKSLSMSKK